MRAGVADPVVETLELEADDASAAQQQAVAQGYLVLASQTIFSFQSLFQSRKPFPVTLFCRELITLLRAGLNVVEAISALAHRTQDNQTERTNVYKELAVVLQSGLTLSLALEKSRVTFPRVLVASVRASELTGGLLQTLERYVAYADRVEALRKRLTSAAIYPSLVLGVAALVMLFLVGYVVPRFSLIYEDLGRELSLSTRWMVAWGHLVHQYGWLLLMGFFVLMGAALLLFRHPAWRAHMIRRLLKMRALGSRLEQFQLARMYRTLAMLLEAGVALLPALKLTRSMASEVMVARLEGVILEISEGQPVAAALQRHQLLDSVGWRMLSVGERSGEMGTMFNNVADFYEEDLGTWLDWITRVAEPVLMTVTGLVIGIVVLLMYMPIFELASSLQ